jgi:hypothetical protein
MKSLAAVSSLCAALLSPGSVWACAVCFGAKGDPQTQSLNMAILTLLGTTYALFAGMFGAGYVLWRRAKKMATAEAAAPPSADRLDSHHG